jgi:chemotaxis response regulator CheB
MAYVFVQRLDPRHGSDLVKILSKRAALPVEETRNGVKISPDLLYVITSNTTLTIINDVLHSRICNPAEKTPSSPSSVNMLLASIQRESSFLAGCPFCASKNGCLNA